MLYINIYHHTSAYIFRAIHTDDSVLIDAFSNNFSISAIILQTALVTLGTILVVAKYSVSRR